jgi:lipoprotein-anchoring transpeptidase ErfK/SrfK
MSVHHTGRAVVFLVPLLLLFAGPRECAAAQHPATALPSRDGAAFLGVAMISETAGQRHVRISLEENRLYVMEGDRVVWSAVIGTGTGDTLEGAGQSWDFSTPPGRYRVQLKERDPVWVLPEWYYVQRGRPIPAADSPERKVEGQLGVAALYLTHEIAIHGTDHPELLGGPISHGCVRMSNEDVLRLYDELNVGAPVLIY